MFLTAIQKYFGFGGRAARLEFWVWQVSVTIAITCLVAEPIVAIVLILALIIPSWAIVVRRFHDLGLSGWFALVLFIPVVDFGAWIYLAFFKGDGTDNDYGLAPTSDGLNARNSAGAFVLLGILAVAIIPTGIGLEKWYTYRIAHTPEKLKEARQNQEETQCRAQFAGDTRKRVKCLQQVYGPTGGTNEWHNRNSPASYYVIDKGEATDTRTNLTWSRCAVGQEWDPAHPYSCHHDPTVFSFAEAQAQGNDEWRLPTTEELATLIDRDNPDLLAYDTYTFPSSDRTRIIYCAKVPDGTPTLMEGNGGRYSGSVNFELAEIGGSQNPRCSVLLVRAQSGKPESTKPTSPVEPAAKAPAK